MRMHELKGLIAYPSEPKAIGTTIKAGIDAFREEGGCSSLKSWEESDIAGRFIETSVLEKIDEGNVLVADITRLNFNVAYEIGYGIGRKRASGEHVYYVNPAFWKGLEISSGNA